MDSPIEHRIQREIIGALIHRKYARFSELRPSKTDTNLFSYHLKVLLKSGMVAKTENGYTLSDAGLGYVDRVSIKKLNVRSQPKIITMLVVRNESGEVLLQRRNKQPYIDTWTLPYGKTHISDPSLTKSAERETLEKLGTAPLSVNHIGDAYIRVTSDGQFLSTTLAHIFTVTLAESPAMNDDLMWHEPSTSDSVAFAPAVTVIIDEVSKSTGHFFVEFDEAWT